MPKVYISKITLPVGNETVTYNFRDEYAQQKLAGGLQFVVCWDGEEPVVANIPAGVVVKYQGENYTGTKAASSAEPLTFYLVKSATQVDVKMFMRSTLLLVLLKPGRKLGILSLISPA